MDIYILFPILLIVAGCAMIYGSYSKWEWLVLPPVENWCFYSQSFIRKFFGDTAVLVFTYVMGGVFALIGVYLLAITYL